MRTVWLIRTEHPVLSSTGVCLKTELPVRFLTPVLSTAQNRLYGAAAHLHVQDLKQDVLRAAFHPPKTSLTCSIFDLVSEWIKAEAHGTDSAARFNVEFGEVKVLTSPNIADI